MPDPEARCFGSPDGAHRFAPCLAEPAWNDCDFCAASRRQPPLRRPPAAAAFREDGA